MEKADQVLRDCTEDFGLKTVKTVSALSLSFFLNLFKLRIMLQQDFGDLQIFSPRLALISRAFPGGRH